MPTSPGNDRPHNNKGATVEAVAEFATNNYAELRRRRDRHAGADERIPLDLFGDSRTTTPNGGLE